MNSRTTINWRILAAIAAGVVILALLNWNIFKRERLITQGQVVLLQLAPVDPRSLMQGDYMALHFALANDLQRLVRTDELKDDGIAVLHLDGNKVAQLVRIDDGRAPLQADEIRLRYRVRGEFDRVKIATNTFFFEEGHGETYTTARYGEFRVDDLGDAILTQLRDGQLKVLGRSAVLD